MFQVNEYFEGKVKSIAFTSAQGPATIGVMAAGEYTFGTSSVEYMTLTSGKMKAKLPGASEFKDIAVNETFIVEANTSFDVVIEEEASYLCVYK
jgi:purine/pyrimidine-nucleoside phosphorylase